MLTTCTGLSRQFGFLRFADVRDASAFLSKNRGILYLYGDGNSTGNERGAKVKIAFSREREDRDRAYDADWKCPNVRLSDTLGPLEDY